jgi:hypothetical protein
VIERRKLPIHPSLLTSDRLASARSISWKILALHLSRARIYKSKRLSRACKNREMRFACDCVNRQSLHVMAHVRL